MAVRGFARLLKQHSPDSEIWWDSSPSLYAAFEESMKLKYSDIYPQIRELLPNGFSNSDTGISGATTNPILITQAVLANPDKWHARAASLCTALSSSEKAARIYDRVIIEGARRLLPLHASSRQRHGWLSAQIEGGDSMDEDALVERGRQLAQLAPNIMIKVPGSEQGYRAIERLVAQGYSINNTFCFSVSQAAAFFKAIHDGRLHAQRQGVNTEHARYVVSFMIGRLGAEDEIRGRLTNPDRRWAELAVYQAIQALRRRWRTPARLLLCSLKVDTDRRGREHCWHLQRTGADTTLYTMTPHIIEFLARRQQQLRPIVPATQGVQVPEGVMHRLMSIDYWRQAYFEGGLAPREFARYPAFITAGRDAREGQQRLLDFVQAAGAGQQRLPIRTTNDQSLECAS